LILNVRLKKRSGCLCSSTSN